MLPFRLVTRTSTTRLLALSLLAAPLLSGCIGGTIRQLRADKEMLAARVMQVSQDLGASQESAIREKQRADAAEAALQSAVKERDAIAARVTELESRRSAAELALQSSSDSQAREVVRRIDEALNNEKTQRLEAERLKDRVGSLEMTISQLQNDNADLEAKLSAATSRTEGDTALLAELRDAIEKQSAEITRLSTERQELTAKVDGLTGEANLATQRASTTEEKVTILEKSVADLTKERDQLKADLAAQQTLLATAEKRVAEASAKVVAVPSTDALRDKLTKALRIWVTAGHVRIIAADGDVRIVMLSDQLFKSASTQLSDEGLKTLGVVAEAMKGESYKTLVVEGHTDNVPVRNMPYPDNWELASARANEVLRWLAGRPEFDAAKLSSMSYSFQRPIEDNKTTEGRRANRRVEIRIGL
ncbi:OmpA family protein [bacterium]|nr:OmpA family protein [bacterium]